MAGTLSIGNVLASAAEENEEMVLPTGMSGQKGGPWNNRQLDKVGSEGNINVVVRSTFPDPLDILPSTFCRV